jgi:hypothetical protein
MTQILPWMKYLWRTTTKFDRGLSKDPGHDLKLATKTRGAPNVRFVPFKKIKPFSPILFDIVSHE